MLIPVAAEPFLEGIRPADLAAVQHPQQLFILHNRDPRQFRPGETGRCISDKEDLRAFYPLITREDYLRMETESFVSRYHNNSVASLIGALRRDELTEADLDELTRFVKEAREKGR